MARPSAARRAAPPARAAASAPAPESALEARIAELEARLAAAEGALRDTQRTAHVGSWTWSVRDGRLSWSPEMYRIFGIDEATFTGSLGDVIAGAIHPDDRAAVEASNRAVALEGRPTPLQYRVVRPDGTTRVVWAEANRLEVDPDGAPATLSGIVVDITERAATEQALRESELRWKFAVEGTGDGLWDWAIRDGTVWFSDQWKAMLGHGADEVGSSLDEWSRRVHPDDLPGALTALDACFRGEAPAYVHEVRMRRRDGTWMWVLDRGIVVERAPDGSPLRMIGTHRDVTGSVRAAEALRAGEARYRSLVEAVPGIVYSVAVGLGTVYISPQVTQILGYPVDRILAEPGVLFDAVHPDDQPAMARVIEAAGRGEPFAYAYRIRHADGGWRWLEDASIRYRHEDGRLVIDGFAVDVTERRRAAAEHDRLVEELAAARHLESLGRLAGGVAHDFNNMLGAIMAHAELALLALDADAAARDDIEQIVGVARRSADLTRQLLAFARRQPVRPRRVDLNAHVAAMLLMLRRLIGERVELAWEPARELPPVVVDPSQLDQLLANLCVNARDAIEGTGRIVIATAPEADADGRPLVALTVTDDGAGMDQATLERIFEPFFTTKATGHGTGLGLATVHGIVEQHGGRVEVASEPGRGTAFRILLPCDAGAAAIAEPPPADPPAAGSETVLVVEDEPSILEPTVRNLERLGYTVLAAGTPADGLRIAEAHAGPIDLLLTDVVMPGMDGRELAARIGAARPTMRRLFMSGYTPDLLDRDGGRDELHDVLAKPFTAAGLAAGVRAALDARPGDATRA